MMDSEYGVFCAFLRWEEFVDLLETGALKAQWDRFLPGSAKDRTLFEVLERVPGLQRLIPETGVVIDFHLLEKNRDMILFDGLLHIYPPCRQSATAFSGRFEDFGVSAEAALWDEEFAIISSQLTELGQRRASAWFLNRLGLKLANEKTLMVCRQIVRVNFDLKRPGTVASSLYTAATVAGGPLQDFESFFGSLTKIDRSTPFEDVLIPDPLLKLCRKSALSSKGRPNFSCASLAVVLRHATEHPKSRVNSATVLRDLIWLKRMGIKDPELALVAILLAEHLGVEWLVALHRRLLPHSVFSCDTLLNQLVNELTRKTTASKSAPPSRNFGQSSLDLKTSDL